MSAAVVLVPAYEPDERLVELVRQLRTDGSTVVVVDDGSGQRFAPIFSAVAALGADVLSYRPNQGKGYALKQGFAHVAARYPGHDVVCADCDGQHLIADIRRVAAEVAVRRDGIVLGARQFVSDVPLRSRFGNGVTRVVLRLTTGLQLQDTQTGLRAYPSERLPWLTRIRGSRFEYEIDVLLAARTAGIPLHEVPIETIYLAGNESSHFRPVRDSVRVYPILRFAMSSLAASAVDAAALFALMAATGHLLASVVGARVLSASVNFLANRRLVFPGSGRDPASAARRYAGLAALLLAANYGMLRMLTNISVGLVSAKVLTESTLFALSYVVQRRFVHDRGSTGHGAARGGTDPRLERPSGVGVSPGTSMGPP